MNEILALSKFKNKTSIFKSISSLNDELFDKLDTFYSNNYEDFFYLGDITPDYDSEFMQTAITDNEFQNTMNLKRFYNLIKHVE